MIAGDDAGGAAPGRLIYCRGGANPSNLVPRDVDRGRLSFFTSPAFAPGDRYIVVDTTMLPPGSVIYDNEPVGHVSVVGVSPEGIRRAIVDKGVVPP